MSRSMLGRIERAELPEVTVRQLSMACASVGLKFVGTAYPDDDPVRDAAHGRLLERFRARMPPGTTWRTEVPLPIEGDARAWDATAELRRALMAIEAEMRLDDMQALERKLKRKMRDGGIAVLILLVAETRRNRDVLATHRGALRETFPLDARAIPGALDKGRLPSAGGIVIL